MHTVSAPIMVAYVRWEQVRVKYVSIAILSYSEDLTYDCVESLPHNARRECKCALILLNGGSLILMVYIVLILGLVFLMRSVYNYRSTQG